MNGKLLGKSDQCEPSLCCCVSMFSHLVRGPIKCYVFGPPYSKLRLLLISLNFFIYFLSPTIVMSGVMEIFSHQIVSEGFTETVIKLAEFKYSILSNINLTVLFEIYLTKHPMFH